ncbi:MULTISPECIES: EAL domain-containing protein [unclassified Actinotalea]|uniref:EAL domain-containing protein n=1 Tax=unclassified Actinotalea TaxID=2638618 RepID=UPI0015F586AD|nr:MULTISPECIES: EAL domain-containing protein [unclassified Actinotalea]
MTHPPTLLVLTPSTGGDYFGGLLTGVARELAAVGGRAVVVQTLEPGLESDQPGEAPDFAVPVGWDEVDGVVAVTYAVGAAYLRSAQEHGLPVVVTSARLDDLTAPSAVADNVGGTRAAVEHLLAHGHTRIGFVGNLVQRDTAERYETLLGTLEDHGLASAPRHLFVAPDNGEAGGRAAAAVFLAADDRPTAVVSGTDRNAVAFLEAVTAGGVAVPGDLAITGFDNIEPASFASPALTTVDQPFDEVGALAARLALRMVAGEEVPPTAHVAPATLVVRWSCGCRPGVGPVAGRPGLRVAVDPRAARDATAHRLRQALVTGRDGRDDAVAPVGEELLDAVERLLRTDPATLRSPGGDPPDVLESLRAALLRSTGRNDALRRVTRTLDEYVRATHRPEHAGLTLAVLREVQAVALLRRSAQVGQMLDEQYAVDVGLLAAADPRTLDWLAGTRVRAAVFAAWDDAGDLRVEGVHDPAGRLGERVGTTVPVERFPHASLVRDADPQERLVCHVLPVRTRERRWGLLALVAEIDPAAARETFHHWSALLASALEQQALQAAVRSNERRYALVAEAARDGLWEYDGVEERTYLSPRARELVGLSGDAPSDVASWRRHVHPDDVVRLAEATAAARRAPGTAVEIEYRTIDDDGRQRWLLYRALAMPGQDGSAGRVVGSLSDIDERKVLEERLRLGALYDEVTGLPNRRHFLGRLRHALEQRQRDPDHRFAVMFLDVDGFKLVNDSLGHLVGDQLLTAIAERLRTELRTCDTAARLGGDEFAVLVTGATPEEVLAVARRAREAVARPVDLAGHEVAVTASIGIATSDTPYTDPEHVLRDADIAMYEAKSAERGTTALFDPEMHTRATERLRTRAELRVALAERQLVVHYQPVVRLADGVACHFEALVRWQHPERGLLLPGEFLPALVDQPAVTALAEQVLDDVCARLAAWGREHTASASVAVNLSHAEFWSADLPGRVRRALERHGVPASRLVLEITESVIMTDPDEARRVMDELHAVGVTLHVDDFGTGQSSLHALRHFPVDALKIDGSFIREMDDPPTAELVRVILEIGQVLGLDVVAECVETPEQAERLRALGCRHAQGWLFGRAVPGDEAGRLLGRRLAPV